MSVIFRWTGAAIASGVMALPLMVRAMRLSIEGVDRRLEGAARTLGAGSLRVFRTITLPLMMRGVLGGRGARLCALDRRIRRDDHLRLQRAGETQTLPLAIYSALQVPGSDGVVMRLALVSIALSLGALLASGMAGAARWGGGPCLLTSRCAGGWGRRPRSRCASPPAPG